MSTIAVLGLGNMGGPMAANLVAAGHTVRGFDPVPAAASAAAEQGVQTSDTAADAVADSEAVLTVLPSGDIVKQTYDEVLGAAPAGALLIDCSTTSVDDARDLHQLAGSHGFAQLDAPISGGAPGAAAGTLTFMIGGEKEQVERARPVLEPMSDEILYCGSSGAGQAAKICNNMVLAVQQIVVGEAFVLADRLGVSAQSMFDVLTNSTGNCWAVHTNCPVPGPVPTSPANHDFEPGATSEVIKKDLGLAMDAARSTGAAAPLGSHAAEIYTEFAARHGDKDFSAVIEMLRDRSE